MTKQRKSKILAGFLAVLMVVSIIPTNILANVFAAGINSYEIRLTDGTDVLDLDDVLITLTSKEDATKTMSSNTIDGIATFENFVEEESTYTLAVAATLGYKDVTESEVTIATDETSRDVVMTPIEKVTVSGIITDENGNVYEGAKVSVSGYITAEVTSNDKGEYSFETYKGKENTISVTAKEDKYIVLTDKLTANENQTKNYQISIKTFDIKTNADTAANGTITSTINGVLYGENREVVATANEGYRIKELKVNGMAVDAAKDQTVYTYSITDIKETYDVSVEFYVATYTVSFDVKANGKVTYNTDQEALGGKVTDVTVNENGSVEFEAIANSADGYHVEKVVVDNKTVLANGTNTDINYKDRVSSDKINVTVNVTVEFALNEYTVRLENVTNGTASLSTLHESGNESVALEHGESVFFIAVPKTGYEIDTVILNDGINEVPIEYQETANGYETANINGTVITSDATISITFVPKTVLPEGSYEITLPTESNVVDGVTYVANGAEVTFKATGDYQRVRINGELKYSGSSVSLTVGENCDVEKITSIEVSKKKVGGWSEKQLLNITYDGTKPTTSEIQNSGSWFKEATTYSFTATDANAGVKEVKYASVNDISAASVITANEGRYSFEVNKEFNGPYYVWVVDYCGNTYATTANVKIDLKDPVITDYSFNTEKNSVVQDIINFLSFGTLCNEEIYVTVTASDKEFDEDISSGLKEITLYCAGNKYETQEVSGNSATFKLTKEEFAEGKAISAIVSDISGRTSEEKSPTDFNYESDVVQITDGNLDASITVDDGLYPASGKNWFNGNTDFNVVVTDNVAGIRSVSIKLNGKSILTDSNNKAIDQDFKKNKTNSESFVINTGLNAKDGKNVLEVTVKNNVGKTKTETKEIYIDTTAPDIIHYEITTVNDKPLDKVLNFLTFGIFFNEQVKITVTADDKNASAGVKEITLFLNNQKYETKMVDAENKATFTVKASVLAENEVYTADISAKATDYVANTTANAVIPTTANSDGIKNSGLMLEKVKPTIVVDFADAASDRNDATKDENLWYAGDVEFTVTAGDVDSGIRNTTISINDKELININYYDDVNVDKETHNEVYNVTTADADVAADGSYTIKVSVTDNAGNVNDTYSQTIYKDVEAPYITGFDFVPEKYVEGKEDTASVQVTDYGFYFKEDTNVVISSSDKAPSAGIKSITYYTVDYTNNVNGVASPQVTELVNKDGQITITVPANFKGQIYAKATDNVNNVTDSFVNPNSAIVESEEKHKEEEHIAFEKAETTYTTNGENATELYANDVDVKLTVTDTYSGIREIEWSVVAPYDTENNQSGKVTLNNDKTIKDGTETDWEQTKSEVNLVTEMQKTITVKNNSNDIVVKVKMTDRAGNTSEEQIKFSIDKKAPEITIVYGEDEVHDETYTDFFNTKRTATITVKERNFRASDVVFAITNTDKTIPTVDLKKDATWTTTEDAENPDETIHVATVPYTVDGDYTFDMSYKDNAENPANVIEQHKFTIDMTKPAVTVVYDNNSAQNGNYYKADRTATITIKEHNFDAERVKVIGVATDNGTATTFPTTSAWKDNGDDTHTATIAYTADSKYTFDIEFNDKANNSIDDYVAEEFYVDKTAPNLSISGVADKSANNGDIIPVITYSDTNFNKDAVTIELSGANNGKVDYKGAYADITNGQTYTYENFEKVQKVDDIYTLAAKLTDKAGNETTMTITFSANRFGSVYDLNNVKDIITKYLQTEQDIVFTETNVDSLEREGIVLKLTKNGTPTTLVEGTDYTVDVSGGNGQWSVYKYTVKKSLFKDDGRYSISIYSKDAAGNVNENIDESKEAEISFGIDKTEPVVIPIDLESGKQYPVEGKKVTIDIKDNLVLENVKIYLNDKEIEYTVEGESYTFFVPESNSVQDVKVVAVDAAGNTYELNVEDFLVSTNIFVRWYNNTPLFIGSIVGVVLLGVGITIFILFGKKKKEEE